MAFDRLANTRKIRVAGADMGLPAMGAMNLFTESHETEPYKGIVVERDLSCGPDERNRLSLFSAEGSKAGDNRDVLVFLHGGGFVRGDMKMPGSPYHDNVALFAARNGLLGVNMTYRLAPQSKYPSGIEDIAAAVEWLGKNARSRGGNPKRVFLFGSSAGATHAGCYIVRGKQHGGQPVTGAILQSGIFDFTTLIGNENGAAYFGADPAKLKEYSTFDALVETATPVLYVLPEFDAELFELGHLALVSAYAKKHKRWPNLLRLMGHNHFTATTSLNSPDTELGEQMLAFIDGVPR